LTADTLVKASAEQVSCEVSGEAVILNLRDSSYYGLDPVGARVWKLLLNGPLPVSSIRDHLLAEFDVAAEQCEADLLELLGRLLEKGLVEVAA